jgi:hypothetical protein
VLQIGKMYARRQQIVAARRARKLARIARDLVPR